MVTRRWFIFRRPFAAWIADSHASPKKQQNKKLLETAEWPVACAVIHMIICSNSNMNHVTNPTYLSKLLYFLATNEKDQFVELQNSEFQSHPWIGDQEAAKSSAIQNCRSCQRSFDMQMLCYSNCYINLIHHLSNRTYGCYRVSRSWFILDENGNTSVRQLHSIEISLNLPSTPRSTLYCK